jgi:glycosyltransferase involved in cell wall biosynthesis
VIEAMACGTPVIAVSRGSMPELIDHGRTGFLVGSVNEAVEALAQVPAIDRRVLRRTVEKRFSIERMADQYADLYRRILAEAGARGTTNII